VGLDARRFVDDLEALRKHFNISRFNILGHSWGSAIVALYAMKYTAHLNKLIVVGTLPLQQYQLAETFRRIEAGRDSSTLRRMAELREARRADPGNAEVCRAYYELWFDGFYGDPKAASRSKGDFCAGTLESRRNKMQNVDRFTQASLGAWDWRDSLKSVNTPALIIHGTKDHLPREGAEAWASSLQNARLVLLDGIGHFPYLEAPDRFFSEVNSFLAK
jgi:proline iminopeptidase